MRNRQSITSFDGPLHTMMDRVYSLLFLFLLGIGGCFHSASKTSKKNHQILSSAASSSEILFPIAPLNQLTILFKGRPESHEIALTFDDNPNPITFKIEAILDREHVPATFFFIGELIDYKKFFPLIRGLARKGYEMGNHSWSHPHWKSLTFRESDEEIERTQKILYEILGFRPCYFRPPFMAFTTSLLRSCWKSHIPVIAFANVGPEDYLNIPARDIVKFVLQNTQGGDIIDRHPLPHTLRALPAIIRGLREKKFMFVTLSHLHSETKR